MWKKKDFSNSEQGAPRSSFYSSGFYDTEVPDNSGFATSTPGVLAPSERVQKPTTPGGIPPSVATLIGSIQSSQQFDALRMTMKLDQWVIFAQHLQGFTVQTGQVVISQGATEVTVYIIENGTVGVHHEDANGKLQLATIGAGSVVGEGAFFSRMPRNASVQAMSPSKLWGLSPMRYAELAHRHPAIALSFVMALGSVVTRRMTNKPKRGAVT
jgi:CRP/FNR family transcriptional regulator, cyclic AMP receptor protein